jgi:hypothetical protein
MKRLNNWPTKFANFVESRRSMPFEWGVNDCCLFSADGIHQAILGIDVAEGFRGTYTNKEEAELLLEKHGGLSALVSKAFASYGFVDVHPNFAGRGDPVLYESPEYGDTLGLCGGSDAMFANFNGGIAFVKMSKVKKAWRI